MSVRHDCDKCTESDAHNCYCDKDKEQMWKEAYNAGFTDAKEIFNNDETEGEN